MVRSLAAPGRRTARWRADLALVAAAFLFGSTFLVVQEAVEEADAVPFLAVRFLVAAAVLAPAALRRPPSSGEVAHGGLAGLCLLAGFVLQTIGLQFTTSSTSAFITYLLVVFVPLIGAVMARTWPSASTVAGVALAMVGLVLLSGGVSGFGRGEWLTLGCALAFAAHIMVLARVSARHDPIRLTCWQILAVGAACVVPGLFVGGYGFGADVWLAAAFCGLGPTAAAFFCMVWAQRVVTPTRAALLLLLEPVFAALLGYVAGERLGVAGLAGAALILTAVVVAEVLPVAADRRRADPVDPGVKLRAR